MTTALQAGLLAACLTLALVLGVTLWLNQTCEAKKLNWLDTISERMPEIVEVGFRCDCGGGCRCCGCEKSHD